MNLKILKNTVPVITIIAIIQIGFSTRMYSQNTKSLNLKEQYFGQNPPGLDPEIFAPGIISTIFHEHSSPIYSPDGKEIFYTLSHKGGHRLMYLKIIKGQWSTPKIAPFSGKYSDDNAHFSADGKRLYFQSRRPIDSLNKKENNLPPWVFRDWYVDKTGDKWSETAILNLSGNKGQTLSGTKYIDKLTDINDPYSNGIYYQTLVNGEYSEPIKMNGDINLGLLKYFGFIAPDESYILFYSLKRPEMPEETMSIFISFRSPDGIWGKAINMGAHINYDGGTSRFPTVSPDGKYLFFNWQKASHSHEGRQLSLVEKSFLGNNPTLGSGDIYWVDAKVIEELKSKNK